jgi:ATP-dependent DNA helicase
MDRCHRIGQTRPVHVYRLATAHSVEGRMLARAGEKLKLEKVIVTAGNFRHDEVSGVMRVSEKMTSRRMVGNDGDAMLRGGRGVLVPRGHIIKLDLSLRP